MQNIKTKTMTNKKREELKGKILDVKKVLNVWTEKTGEKKTQADLARELEMGNPISITMYKRGENVPNMTKVLIIEELTGQPIQNLVKNKE